MLRLAENGKKATELLKAEGRCGFQVVDKSILSAQGKAIWRKSLALARTPEALETLSKTNKERYQNDPEYRAHLTKISELGGIASNLFITDCQRKARRMNGLKSCYEKWHKGKFNTFEAYLDHHRNAAETSPNHKVVSIEFAGYEDVYDLTVDDYHNFALSAGVFAHNCPAYHVKDTMAGGATTITCITWGMLQKMTRAFWEKYCDESHTLLGAAWDPAGFNTAQLKADLATVAG